MPNRSKLHFSLLVSCFMVLATACTPTVQVQAPDKPIEINLNVKIEQEVRIKVEKDLESVFSENADIFGLEE